MFLTVHAASAIIIGQIAPNPALALLGGLLAHFALDAIPHGDQDLIEEKKDKFNFTTKEIKKLRLIGIIDTIVMLGLLATLILMGKAPLTPNIVASIFGALLPDFLNAVFVFTRVHWLKGYFTFQHALHYAFNGFTINLKTGFVVQAIFLVGFLSLILKLK